MARTKKKRNYKKAPKNTRVFRCVQKVKKKQEIGAAIAICQSSTKQSYRTGKTLKKKGGNGKKKVKKTKKGIALTDGKGLPKPWQYLESDIDKYKNLPAFKDDRERILVGGAPKFACGADKDFVPEVHFNDLESIFKKLKEDTTGTALEEIVDELPSIRRGERGSSDRSKCYGCKKLIDELVKNTMPSFVGPKILPIKNDDILWLQQFTGVHKGRMCTIMGGRRKKKTRKMRGGFRVILKENRLARGRKTGDAHPTFRAGMSGIVEEVQQIADRDNPQSFTEFWKVTFDRPVDWVTSGRSDYTGLTKLWPAAWFERTDVVQQENNQQGSGKRLKKKTRKKKGGKRRKKKTRKKRGGADKDLSAEKLKAALDNSLSYHIQLFSQLVEADKEFNYKFRHPDFKGPHKGPSVEEKLFEKYKDWRYNKMMEHKRILIDYSDEMGQAISNAPIKWLDGTMDFYCNNWKSELGERLKNSKLNFKEINKEKIQEINREHFFEWGKLVKKSKSLEKLYLKFIDRIKEIYEVYKEKKKMKDVEERKEKKETDDEEYGKFDEKMYVTIVKEDGTKDKREYDDALDKYREYYKGEDIKPMMKAYFDNNGFGWDGKAPNEILGQYNYEKVLIDITKHTKDNIDEEFNYHYFDGEWVEITTEKSIKPIVWVIENTENSINKFANSKLPERVKDSLTIGFDKMIETMTQDAEKTGGFWIVEWDKEREKDDTYNNFHLSWSDYDTEPLNVIRFVEPTGGGRGRKKKTRKKRGKGGVFSCPGCGDKKKKKQERDFYTVIDSYGNKQKMYYSDDDSYSSDEDLKPMADYEQEEEIPLIEKPVPLSQPVRRLVRIPSEGSLKLGSEKIKEWQRARSTSPTMDPGTAAHHNLPIDHFAKVDKIMEIAAKKGLGGGRRKKKTRKKRGHRKKKTRKKRGGNGDKGNWYYITNSNGESFYGGVIAHEEKNSIVLLIADGDEEFQWKSYLFPKDNLSSFRKITDMDSEAPASNSALIKAIDAWDKGKREITVKKGMLKTPPQSPRKKGGSKSKRVKSLIKIFQQYPEIFPSGYFRFLGARLQNHIDKKTLWYKNGVILTWIKYQKTVKKKPKCIIKPGDVKLDQIVNKNQGNGAAKKIVLQFLEKFKKDRIWLEVRANNKRAIRFYKDRGFKRVCEIKFGEIPGIMMVKN
jgi:hypothetical protein